MFYRILLLSCLVIVIGSTSVNAQIDGPFGDVVGPSGGVVVEDSGEREFEEGCAMIGNLIINEVGNYTDPKSGKSSEYIELLVVGGDPNLPVNVAGFIIDDNNASNSAHGSTRGHIRLGNCFTEVMPGTIILLFDDALNIPDINRQRDGAPNAEGVYQIPFNHPCITYVKNCPIGLTTTYMCLPGMYGTKVEEWSRYIGLGDNVDVAQVRNPSSSLEHALMWWGEKSEKTNRFPDQSNARAVKVSEAPVANKSISFVDDNPYKRENYKVTNDFTPGFPNSAENQAYIDGLKPIICPGESIVLGCEGSEDYCYVWSPADIVTAGSRGSADVTPVRNTVLRRTTIDEAGDIVNETAFFIRVRPAFTVTISEQQLKRANCPAESDFRFTAAVSGTYPSYEFAWPDGQTTATVVLSGAKTYALTVTPPNGCSQVIPVTAVGNPDMLASVSISSSRTSVCGNEPIQLVASMKDYLGNDEYTYQWSNGATTGINQVTLAGEYRVTVTSKGGCSFTDTVQLAESFDLSIVASGTQACAENPVVLTADVFGNDNFNFAYRWSNGGIGSSIEITEGGEYSLTVSNDEGCSLVDEIFIDEGVSLLLEAATERLIPGGMVTITSKVTNGTPPYSYSWSSGATSSVLAVNVAGAYTLSVTDAFGCEDEATVTILPFDESLCEGFEATILFNEPDCDFYGSARLESMVSSGFEVSSYSWSTGAMAEDLLIDVGDQVYSLTVTGTNGCQTDASISVPVFSTLNSLSAAEDFCDLIDFFEVVSLADNQAILVTEGLTETVLSDLMTNMPNTRLEVIAKYESTSGLVRAVVPFATTSDIPDPSTWAGDLFDVPEATDITISLQVSGWEYCPVACTKEKILFNTGATNEDEVVLEENPAIRLTDYECGDVYEPDEDFDSEVPLIVLNKGDIITVNGFPLLVATLQQNASSSGQYTGTGIVPLPFNDRTVQVSFTNAFINENRALKRGIVEGIRDQLSNYDYSMNTFAIGVDICVPAVNEDGFTDEGINPVTGLDRFGFVDSTGLHSVTRTEWDPNGFDVNGNHRETGGIYNGDGCNREGRNAEGGECHLVPFIDPAAQAFIDSVNTVLDGLAYSALNQQIAVADAAFQQQVFKCGAIRDDITTLIGTLQFQPDFIVGDSSQYLNRGMSERFTSEPTVFPTADPERNPQVVELEEKHVALYGCDVIDILMSDTLAAYQGADAGAVKEYLLLQLSYLSAEAIDALKVGDAFSVWIAEKVAAYLLTLIPDDDRVGDSSSPVPAASFKTPNQVFNNLGTYANADESTYFGSREELVAYELNAQFNQGFQVIQGVHRAHFLARIAELRAEDDEEERQGLLPITVTKYIGGVQYTILLDDMTFNPASGARLSAYLIIEDPESGQNLVFQATNVGFGVGGAETSRLELASTVAIRLNNAAKLILDANRTFAEWDCQGFVGAGVGGKVEMCREFITPLHEQTLEPLPDTVRFALNFETYVTEWLDAVVTVDAGAFAVTNNESVKWQLDSAVVDLSDHYTPQFTPTEGYASPHYSEEGMSPLWRGFYMQNLSATLSSDFNSDAAPVTIGVEDVLIDQSGFTGEVYVEGVNLLDIGEGSAGGWPFSINRFNIKVLHNSLAGAGFGGEIIVPVFKERMNYDARIYRHNRYKFTVQPDSLLSMDMLLAEVKLHPSSKIELGYDYDGFLAVADLTGDLTFDIPTGEVIDITMPEVYFKGFRVSNRDPYFDSGTWEIRNLGLSLDFGGFGMDISRISPYRGVTNKEVGLGFDLAIGLGGDDLDLSAGGSFGILGELEEINQRQKWKFKTIDLKGLFIDANIKDVVHVKGSLIWYKNNLQYGKGFQGLLQAEFTKEPLDFSASVSAQFGKKDDTKYFFVDAMVGLGSGIPIGPLNINGFGGGVSYHMDNTFVVDDMDFAAATPPTAMPAIGSSFSGTHYFVAPEYGIGLKAAVMVATQSKMLFNGWAGLEFLFNSSRGDGSGGGLAKVSFKGQGQFMGDILSSPPDFLQDIADYPGDTLPTKESPDLGAPLSAWVDLSYNFNENVFDGKLEAYLNAGILRGAGANNALVQAAVHVDSDDWYFNVGTPRNPAGLLVDLPFFKAGATAYFNMGTSIPDFPGLPRKVASLARLYNNNEGLRKSGGGIMFGANIYSRVDLNLGPVRGFLEADLGFDLMLRNYGGAICTNTGSQVGLNGWYASGQAWVYIAGGVKILGISVAEFGLAGIMQARLPNPIWAKATLAAQVKLLFAKKRVNFNVEIGKRCELQDENGEDLPENPIINYINPLNSEKSVAGDIIPQVYFNYPIGEVFKDENGDDFRTRVSETSIYSLGGGYAISYEKTWTNDGTTLNLEPHQFLPADDSIRISITVQVMKGSQIERTESRQVIFYTAPAYDFIPVSNVKYSYPVDGMYDFYPEEYRLKQGFIQLNQGQPNILLNTNLGEKNIILLTSASGEKHTVSFTYSVSERRLTFPLSPEILNAGSVYSLSVVRVAKGKAAKELLAPIYFRVSQFARFSQKIQAINNSPAVPGSNDYSLQLTGDAILGDAARIGIGALAPLVKITADVSSPYISQLNKLINDRFPIFDQACGYVSYADVADFENLRDAAGISARGGKQSVLITEDQFNGNPLILDVEQRATYQVVNESRKRYVAVKHQAAGCIMDAIAESEESNTGGPIQITGQGPGADVDFIHASRWPVAPATTYKLLVSYVIPGVPSPSSNGNIMVPQ